MAGDWIKFESATSDKPEVWAIASSLGIDPDAVVGKLLRVWAWFDQHTTDGNAPVTVAALLDRLVGVTGFCEKLTQAGWLDNDGKVIHIPNFDAHNGETAKKRCQTAKRVAKHKKTNAKVTLVPLPNALPREDDREDSNQSINQDIYITPFGMNRDWFPDKELQSQLLCAGIRENWADYHDEFVDYWMGRPDEKQNHFGWQNKFLKNIKAQYERKTARLG